ncbi:hypothetical protein ACFFNY_21415 [Paenibacillus hodogayensis]|uniref:Copper amine oxidase N-terminal domain-containing protein n=1 Tax=Paenibacillus hodogayensis TaxID=279208 RepID=A0ABV5W0S8_9BACL
MRRLSKRISVMLAFGLIATLFAALPAMAANEKRFDMKNGGYVTISNFVETQKIEDVGYGETMYVVSAPATITFHGKLSDETAIAKWVDDESLDYVDITDNKAVLTEEVEYGIFPIFQGETRESNPPIILQVIAGKKEASQPKPTTSEAKASPTPVTAAPTAAKVVVNGKNVAFEAYTIEGNNYFKLRDLAMSVNGTDKSFEVSWDAAKNAIALTSKKAYTPDGSELGVSGKPVSQQVTETTANVTLDGKDVKFTAYLIGGNNYFKLRDVAQLMNIGVTWDATAGSIGIDTKAAYVE